MTDVTQDSRPPYDLQALDSWTGGAFSAPTSGERASRIREWLGTEPSEEQVQEVYRELSVKDKGAAKLVREKLDEIKRARGQEAIAAEWVAKAQTLLQMPRLHIADALAWQRDAAKAGAPLSREPLLSLKGQLADQIKVIEDLQHRAQVQREAAVLLAQRIEVLSTKPWRDARAVWDSLRADVAHWQAQADTLLADAHWHSVDAKFPPLLESARSQLLLVWDAFDSALTQAVAAAEDGAADLPPVPVWANELRVARGIPVQAVAPAPKAPLEPQVQAQTAAREALVARAEALLQRPEGQGLGGRKMQESLRALRDEWKQVDQGGAPNQALWKRFDEACNQAHKVVEQWVEKIKTESAQHRAERLALIGEVTAWAAANQTARDDDWKGFARVLHQFSERWRQAGHLSEKSFAELQPQWKAAIHAAAEPLEAVQQQSVQRRQAMIEEAVTLGAAPVLRIDAVKALQQRWQAEAHAVPLERRQEQKLWEAFRQPIDEAFNRKTSTREQTATPLSAHDRAVLDAAKALEAASASGDAQQIRRAMGEMDALLHAAPQVADKSEKVVPDQPDTEAPSAGAEEAATPPAAPAPRKPVVAVRGDDRPGMKKAEPVPPAGRGRPADRRDGGRGPREFEAGRRNAEPVQRGPRLGDVAFRAQREALEQAQFALKKLAMQAHGEVLTRLLEAWEQRDASQVPGGQELGAKVSPAARTLWAQALGSAPAAADDARNALLRLEMAAELPSPAAELDARRALQLQMLTRRNEPSPSQTWGQDVARVLAGAFEAGQGRRLQQALKALLKR